jgi:ubiquinone/menaquinone biosynthesis C-methylase UbiE
MSDSTGYVLGQAASAARRLEVQDEQFAGPSEQLLDDLALRPGDRVVELGCGPGGMSRRILRRLGPAGVVVGVDGSPGFLDQARAALAGAGRFEPVVADITTFGPWLAGADVVIGRNVLHHVPMAEVLISRLRAAVQPGTRVGFIEPDFRTPVARLGYLEATGRPDVAPLRVWATVINQLYLTRRISPAVGATLGRAMEAAGYSDVRAAWSEHPTDSTVVDNLVMFYDEVRDTLATLGILTSPEVDAQQRLLRALPAGPLPAAWGAHVVSGRA